MKAVPTNTVVSEEGQGLTEEWVPLPPSERDRRTYSSALQLPAPKLSCNRKILSDYGSPKGSKSGVSHRLFI